MNKARGYGSIDVHQNSTLLSDGHTYGLVDRNYSATKIYGKGKSTLKIDEDFDMNAFLASTSVTSLTAEFYSNKKAAASETKDNSRTKGKAKEMEAEEANRKEKESERKGKMGSGKEKEAIEKPADGRIIHTIAPMETLEGIAVKYGVQVRSFLVFAIIWIQMHKRQFVHLALVLAKPNRGLFEVFHFLSGG